MDFELLGLILFVAVVAIALFYLYVNSGRSRGGGRSGATATTAPIREGGVERRLTLSQKEVTKRYSSLRPTARRSFESICFPKKFQVQSPQKFVGVWLAPAGKHKELIAFHGIGSGKTCAAIQAILPWLGKGHSGGRPLVVAPASLLPGFRRELRSPCGGGRFCSESQAKILAQIDHVDYSSTLAEVNEAIDQEIDLLSYNKFYDIARGKTKRRLSPSIMVLDEAHNFCNLAGNYNKVAQDFVEANPSMRILLMTATPIYDKPEDLVGLLALARRPGLTPEVIVQPAKLAKAVDGLISYYSGAPPYTYPETTIKYSLSAMSQFQSSWYLSQVEKEMRRNGELATHAVSNDFYSTSRARSICVFRDGLGGAAGLASMRKKDLVGKALAQFSCKVSQLVARLMRGSKLSFVYSNFSGPNGVAFIVKVLRANGWKHYMEPGPGRHYAVFSGEESAREKGRVAEIFNSAENNHGKKIQVVIGSPAIKEGVSFFRIRQVHILDPYWNYSRIEQIYGRASRYCSHKSLPEEKRRVSVYIYVAAIGKARDMTLRQIIKRADPMISVDALILALAEKKLEERTAVLGTLVSAAVDKPLGYNSRD